VRWRVLIQTVTRKKDRTTTTARFHSLQIAENQQKFKLKYMQRKLK
jgi:hypothetical protein